EEMRVENLQAVGRAMREGGGAALDAGRTAATPAAELRSAGQGWRPIPLCEIACISGLRGGKLGPMSNRRSPLQTTGGRLGASALRAQQQKELEIAVTAATPETARITIQPIENGQPQPIPDDGALVKQNWGEPVLRLREFHGSRRVKCGNLTVTVF